jgi:hypothetical protein
MKKIKLTVTLLAIATCSLVSANPTYQDWNKIQVPVTVDEPHYGGQYQCSYTQQLFGVMPGVTIGNLPQNYQLQKRHQRYIPDTLVPRPVIKVTDLFHQLDSSSGFFHTNPYHQYDCKGNTDLPVIRVEKKVIGTKTEYQPRQPFPQYATYEYMACNTSRVREGNLYVSGLAGASSMVVTDITAGSSTHYSGSATPWIALNSSEFGARWLSIKLDNGSSYYLRVDIPVCTGNGDDPNPV